MLDNESGFSQAMSEQGVTPTRFSHRARLARGLLDDDTAQLRRRAAAEPDDDQVLSVQPLDWLDPLDPIGWRAEGIQQGVYRNLRLARYQVDARLDLSQRSPAQARDELVQMIEQSYRLGIRCFMVHIGRSNQRQGRANQLKTYLNQWLRRLKVVQAFHSAQPQHGGTAAVYVMLQKNAQARQDNWEKHQKRGG